MENKNEFRAKRKITKDGMFLTNYTSDKVGEVLKHHIT